MNKQAENRPLNYNLRLRSQGLEDTTQPEETTQPEATNQPGETAQSENTTHSVDTAQNEDTAPSQLPNQSTTPPGSDTIVIEGTIQQSNTSTNPSTSTSSNIPHEQTMTTGFTLQKFGGTESPVIWISKLEAWQTFYNYSDNKVLAMLPCALDGSASTWFQSLQPPCASLTAFKTKLKERFQPIEYGMPLMGIQQQIDETTDSFIERAERTGLGHNIEEQYKVQATASGLLPMLRGKVLAREPKTFQQLRKAVSLVKMEVSGYSGASSETSEIKNLCAMFTNQMSELQKTLQGQINAVTTNQQNERNDNPQRRFRPQEQRRAPHHNPQKHQSERHEQNECPGCGKSCRTRISCPAFNAKCNYCSKWHHFERVCYKKQRYYNNTQNTNTNHSS